MQPRDADGVAQLVAAALAIWASTGSVAWAIDASGDWNRVDTLTVVLACVTVVLTVLGIIIAVLALWGYRHFREIATDTAREVAGPIAAKIAKEVAEPIAARAAEEITRQGGGTGDYGAAAAAEER